MMKNFNRVITWVLATGIVLLLVFAGLKHFRKPSPHVMEMMRFKEVMQAAEPAFTTLEAKALAKELIPLVEEAAGRKFKQPPKIKLIDRDTLAKVLLQDLLPQFINLMPEAGSGQIMEIAGNQADWMTPFIIGKYGFMDRVLYLVPGNVYPVMNLKKIKKRHTQAIVKMLIAHELTHALQDQQIGLKQKFDGIKSLEASEAFNETIEGHAVFIQDLVGKKLQMDEALFDRSRSMAAGSVMFEEPMLEMQHEMAETRFKMIYLGGRDFVQYHYNKGGNRKVWEILAAPPAVSAMILEPESYAPTVEEKVNYAELLKGVERLFGNQDWGIQNLEVPKINLDAYYKSLDPKDKKELMSKIAHVQALNIDIDKEDVAGIVSVVILKDHAYGPKFITLAEKMVANRARKLDNSNMYQMENLVFDQFSGINAQAARRLSFTLKPVNGERLQTAAVRVCLDNIVVEITDVNIGLDDEAFKNIAETVYQRYQEAVAQHNRQQSDLDCFSTRLRKAACQVLLSIG